MEEIICTSCDDVHLPIASFARRWLEHAHLRKVVANHIQQSDGRVFKQGEHFDYEGSPFAEGTKSKHHLAKMEVCDNHLLLIGIALTVDAAVPRDKINLLSQSIPCGFDVGGRHDVSRVVGSKAPVGDCVEDELRMR
jgi:hypothetical protein